MESLITMGEASDDGKATEQDVTAPVTLDPDEKLNLQDSCTRPAEVACDFCLEKTERAVKTCLTCASSYCEAHIRRHYTAPALQKHKLVDTCGDLEERNSQQNVENRIAKALPPPGNIEICSVGADFVVLSWDVPEGLAEQIKDFIVTWSDERSQKSLKVKSIHKIKIEDLSPGNKYVFKVASVGDGDRQSACVSASVQTDRNEFTEIPAPELSVEELHARSFTIKWNKPNLLEKIPHRYFISSTCPKAEPVYTADLKMTFSDLEPDTCYTVEVATILENGEQSEPTSEKIHTSRLRLNEPVCLIENTTNNELKVNQEAVDILKSFHQPVVVMSIVGMYRTGKSYLMNRLAGKRKGFALGSTIQSKTKGIWMWCVPVPGEKEHTLVLLDTEGLGDVEKGNEKNDHWIFSLAVLLSSTLIYNSTGTINNDAVMKLQYVNELTKYIKVKSSDEDEADASAEFVRFFPSFIWAVRDFTLELEVDGKPITADEYLENSLKLKPEEKDSISFSVRKGIRTYFPRRKCFVFDMPVPKKKLKIIDQLSDSDLDEEFVQQATEFCSYVLENSQVKTIKGGIKVTGNLLAKLVTTYVDTIKSGKVPCLENALVALAHMENSKAVEEAHSIYKLLLSERIVLHTETQEELSNVHDICLKEALKVFMDRSFRDDDWRFQRQLMELVRNEYDKKCQENEKLSLNHCTDLLSQLENDTLKPDDYMRPGGYQDFQHDLEDLTVRYRNIKGKGIKAEHALEKYLAEKNELGKMILMADRSLSEQQKHIEEQHAYAKIQEEKAKAAEEEKKSLDRRIEDVKRAEEENKKQLMEKTERERRDMKSEYERVLALKLKEEQALREQGTEIRSLQEEREQLQQEMQENEERSNNSNKDKCSIS